MVVRVALSCENERSAGRGASGAVRGSVALCRSGVVTRDSVCLFRYFLAVKLRSAELIIFILGCVRYG